PRATHPPSTTRPDQRPQTQRQERPPSLHEPIATTKTSHIQPRRRQITVLSPVGLHVTPRRHRSQGGVRTRHTPVGDIPHPPRSLFSAQWAFTSPHVATGAK